jgi:hypothetical protein
MAKYYKFDDTYTGAGVAVYTVQDVEPKNGRDFSLDELQGYVDGLIEIVSLYDGRLMVVNDEGLINGLPINPLATAIFQNATGTDDYILGNVLICDDNQIL